MSWPRVWRCEQREKPEAAKRDLIFGAGKQGFVPVTWRFHSVHGNSGPEADPSIVRARSGPGHSIWQFHADPSILFERPKWTRVFELNTHSLFAMIVSAFRVFCTMIDGFEWQVRDSFDLNDMPGLGYLNIFEQPNFNLMFVQLPFCCTVVRNALAMTR